MRLQGILRRGTSEFLSPVMIIAKSHSGAKLKSPKSTNFRLLCDYRFLNQYLPKLKFSYPELKYILRKIGASEAKVFSVLDLKTAFYAINLHPDSIKYTTCCAYVGGPCYQHRKLPMGLAVSPGEFVNLMNNIKQELPDDVRNCVEIVMDDCICFTKDISSMKRVLGSVLEILTKHGLLLTVNKIQCFRHTVKYLGLQITSSREGYPVVTRTTGNTC